MKRYKVTVDYIEPFADERHDVSCIHCGAPKDGRQFTRDHVPTKSLLDRPLPENLPTFDICGECNNKLSRDEEYLKLLLTCIFQGTCEPDELKDEKAARALARNGALLSEFRRARTEYRTLGGDTRVTWRPDQARVIPPLIKNARGHFVYELAEREDGEPLRVGVAPLQSLDEATRVAFEAVHIGDGWPEVGSRMMTRLIGGADFSGGWIIVQPGVYRYAIHQYSTVRIVIREYLAFEAIWD